MEQFTTEAIERRILERWSDESGVLESARSLLEKCGNKIEILCKAWLLPELNKELEDAYKENNGISEEGSTKNTKEIISNFARTEWGKKANKIFLEDTDRFEIIEAKIMRISSKEIATELYFRIKTGEQSFDMASYVYGEGIEREKGGRINCRVKEFPYGLGKYIKQLDEGELTKPVRIKKFFVIVELTQKINASYNDTVEKEICMKLFSDWVERLVKQMVKGLELDKPMQLT